jgi:hypothetical protein
MAVTAPAVDVLVERISIEAKTVLKKHLAK